MCRYYKIHLLRLKELEGMNRKRSGYIRADRSTKIRLTETMTISRSLAGKHLTKSARKSTEGPRL